MLKEKHEEVSINVWLKFYLLLFENKIRIITIIAIKLITVIAKYSTNLNEYIFNVVLIAVQNSSNQNSNV